MSHYEYKVVPAPAKGLKARGVKRPEDRFANALEDIMNVMGAEGWEYQRAETLPSQERSGLTGTATTYRNVMVFRRQHAEKISSVSPTVHAPSKGASPEISDNKRLEPALENSNKAASDSVGKQDPDRPASQPGAVQMLKDNGVEEASEVAGMTAALKSRAEQQSKA